LEGPKVNGLIEGLKRPRPKLGCSALEEEEEEEEGEEEEEETWLPNPTFSK